MMDLFFADHAGWFTVPAAFGTFVFVVRLCLLLVGGATDADIGDAATADVDFDVHGDVHADIGTDAVGEVHHGSHLDPGHALQILSVQSISAFLMGFGLGGLGAYRGTGWDILPSVFTALVIGVAFMWIIIMLMRAMYKLESSGNVSIRDAVGREGSVYVTIPANGAGTGQISIILNKRQRMYRARTDGETELARHTRVKVVRINDARTLTVEPV